VILYVRYRNVLVFYVASLKRASGVQLYDDNSEFLDERDKIVILGSCTNPRWKFDVQACSGLFSGNALDLHPRGAPFESLPEQLLLWLRILVGFFVPSIQCRNHTSTRLRPRPSQSFSIHYLPISLSYSWDSAVRIGTGYGLYGWGARVRVPAGARIFSMSSRPVLGPT
jgi:hypothetical protein